MITSSGDRLCKGIWAYWAHYNILIIQTESKIIKVIELNWQYNSDKKQFIQLSHIPDQITVHPERDIFMITFKGEGNLILYDHKVNYLGCIKFGEKLDKAMFTKKCQFILVIGVNRLKVYDSNNNLKHQIQTPHMKDITKPASFCKLSPEGNFLAVIVTISIPKPTDHIFVYHAVTWQLIIKIPMPDITLTAGFLWTSEEELCAYSFNFHYYVRKALVFQSIQFEQDDSKEDNYYEWKEKEKHRQPVMSFSPGNQHMGIENALNIGPHMLLLIENKGFRILRTQDFEEKKYFDFSNTNRKEWSNVIANRQKDNCYSLIQFESFSVSTLIVKQMSNLKQSKQKQRQRQKKPYTINAKVSKFNHQFTAFQLGHCKNTLLIWNNYKLSWFEMIRMKGNIESFDWCPNRNILLFSSRGDNISFWSTQITASQYIPEELDSRCKKSPKRKLNQQNDETEFQYQPQYTNSYKITQMNWNLPRLVELVYTTTGRMDHKYVKLLDFDENGLELWEMGDKNVKNQQQQGMYEQNQIKQENNGNELFPQFVVKDLQKFYT